MDSMTIETSKKNIYRIGDSTGGNRFQISLPNTVDCKLLALQGGFGGHMHNIGVILERCPEWNWDNHKTFPKTFRDTVKTILLISVCDKNGNPYHPEVNFWLLPREILFLIFKILSRSYQKREYTLKLEGETKVYNNYYGIPKLNASK